MQKKIKGSLMLLRNISDIQKPDNTASKFLCRLIFNQKTIYIPNPCKTLHYMCLKKINKRDMVYTHTPQLVIPAYTAKSFIATSITCS